MVAAQSSFMSAMLGESPGSASGMAWFDRMRSAALERANAVPLPTTRDEEWRFTDLAPLARLSFQPVLAPGAVGAEQVRERTLPESRGLLVFVDGVLSPALSRVPGGGGLHILNLSQAMDRHAALLEQHLGRLAPPDANVFSALNTAFLRHAAVLVVDAGCDVPEPVHLLYLATRHDRPHATYPRTLMIAGRQSRCSLIEDYSALDDAAYFSAPVTEIAIGEDASVSHVRLQRESGDAFQLATCAAAQGSGSRYQMVSIGLGGRLSRLDLNVLHLGAGCETQIDGLALLGRRQLADTHSAVDHAHPDGRLRQLHKCVVGGGAHAVFNGKIVVREGAQHTDAAQSCRGLLLSDRAHIDAKPQLEIFADDVKCAHGAAIGQLDPDEMFYLQSRGLTQARARSLLTYAFAAEVIERIPVPTLRARLVQSVLERTQEAA